VTFIAGREGELELTVMGADGDLRRVVRRVPGRQHFFPRFSPDGEWIAFFSDSADETKPIHGQPALMRIRVDGTDEQTIVTRERTLSRTEPSSSRRR
jgi:Tol biopolymer transport system component